jgi:ABC-type transport system involved in multi-copper enzyme maturation permease subunit
MNTPAVLYALRWLIYDTFRQALSSRVFWIMFGCSTLCIVFCLGVSVEGGTIKDEGELFTPSGKVLSGPNPEPGELSLLFGVFRANFSRSAEQEVHFVLSIFASWVAGTVGILMALVWTAGFLPEALHASAASVLLAKPVPRWLFLTGKYLGVICFVALHAAIFFLGTWLAVGIRTGIWPTEYLMGAPILVFHFTVIFSFSVMLAVQFRSTMACVVGGVLFWIACYGINYGRHFAVAYAELNPSGPPISALTVFLSELGYWLLPKPVDFTICLEKALNLGVGKMTLEMQQPFQTVLRPDSDLFHPLLAILSSCGFSGFALWTSAAHLAKTDY